MFAAQLALAQSPSVMIMFEVQSYPPIPLPYPAACTSQYNGEKVEMPRMIKILDRIKSFTDEMQKTRMI